MLTSLKPSMCSILCFIRGLKAQLSAWCLFVHMEHLSQLFDLWSLWHIGLNSLVILLRILEGYAWAWMYIPLEHTNIYLCGKTYHCFPGIGSSIAGLWVLVNHFKCGCEGAECLKTLVTFPLRGAFVSVLSRMVSSIKCGVFPLTFIHHISSSGTFLLRLEKLSVSYSVAVV